MTELAKEDRLYDEGCALCGSSAIVHHLKVGLEACGSWVCGRHGTWHEAAAEVERRLALRESQPNPFARFVLAGAQQVTLDLPPPKASPSTALSYRCVDCGKLGTAPHDCDAYRASKASPPTPERCRGCSSDGTAPLCETCVAWMAANPWREEPSGGGSSDPTTQVWCCWECEELAQVDSLGHCAYCAHRLKFPDATSAFVMRQRDEKRIASALRDLDRPSKPRRDRWGREIQWIPAYPKELEWEGDE